jgi:hypothetical protein
MRARALRSLVVLGLAVVACKDSAGPETTLPLPGPADLNATVHQSAHQEFISPTGAISQYALWIKLPAGTPDAGVLVGEQTPVFLRTNGKLSPTTGAAIRAGDHVQVWRDASVAYGTTQAPAGAPCYRATQVVIER